MTEKIVRDLLPFQDPFMRVRYAAPEEREALLEAKLREEWAEWLMSGEDDLTELADLCEAAFRLAQVKGRSLPAIMKAKATDKGTFDRCTVWDDGL